jgi:hypothetical protein
MAQYPFGDHDDLLDGTQMAVNSVFKPKSRVAVKPKWL